MTVRLQKNSAPCTGVVENKIQVTGDRDLYEITGVSPLTLAAEDMALAFNFADRKQTIDIGLLYVSDLGSER